VLQRCPTFRLLETPGRDRRGKSGQIHGAA
jgi:hypothetical protein